MSFITRILIVAACVFIASCRHTEEVPTNNAFGWKSLKTPRAQVLGRQIYSGGEIGESVITLTDKNVLTASVSDDYLKEKNSQIDASLELSIKDATAKAGGNYVSGEKLTASGLRVQQIVEFLSEAPTNIPFVYQCLMAERYEFAVEKKASAEASIDASALAKKFAVDVAKVEVKADPKKPDVLTVKINNSDVCFAYLPVRFVDASTKPWGCSVAGKKVEFYSIKNKPTFMLDEGEYSNWRSAEFCGKEPPQEPWYRLQSKTEESGKRHLEICTLYRQIGKTEVKCKPVAIDGTPTHVVTYQYDEKKYKSISATVRAVNDNGIIHILEAYLTYPEYELKFE